MCMKIDQLQYYSEQFIGDSKLGDSAQWVLIFGDGKLIRDRQIFDKIRSKYPKAYLMGCSTAGEICGSSANSNSIVITAIEFEKSTIDFKSYSIISGSSRDSYEVGKKIIED